MRRTWLRGRDHVAKRYLIHVAGAYLGLLMRALVGAGTPRAAAEMRLFWSIADDRVLLVLLAPTVARSVPPAAFAVTTVTPDDRALSTGC